MQRQTAAAAARTTPASRPLTLVALICALVIAAALVTTATPRSAHADQPNRASSTRDAAAAHERTIVVKVAHGAVTANLVPVVADQASPGDLRTYYTKLTRVNGKGRIGSMTGSLLTTAVDKPRAGWQLRTADLVFTVRGRSNQIVVGGVARYKTKAATLAKRDVVVRPVVGGSGRYDGATGSAKSIHLPDNTWKHIFTITITVTD